MEPKMTKMSTLTGLFLWTVAAQAAPIVTLSGECGAWVTASVTLDAEGDYRMIWGDAGIVSVPMGRCAGTEVGVDGPASPMRTAVGGLDAAAFPTAAERCTQSVQVIDLATCEVSPVVSLSTLPGVGYAGGYDDGHADGHAAGLGECDPLAGYDDGHADGLAEGGGGGLNCFQSSYCWHADIWFLTGLPVSRVGHATRDECSEGPPCFIDCENAEWTAGQNAISPLTGPLFPEFPFYSFIELICTD